VTTYHIPQPGYKISVSTQSPTVTEYNGVPLASLLDYVNDAVWLVDTNLRTLDVNMAACRLMGWQREGVLGLSYQELLATAPDCGHTNLLRYLKQSISRAEKVSFLHGITLLPGYERAIRIEGEVHPLIGRRQIGGAVIVFRQVSCHTETERLQADFISMASHSLRTPLMSIQASMDYILEAQTGEIKNKHVLENVRIQSRKIALLLRELLDTSQLASGKEIPVRIQSFALEDLIETVARDFIAFYPETRFEFNAPSILPSIATDKAKAELVLRNLLNHARRRSKAWGAIKIAVEHRSEDIVVVISDEGTLVAPEQQEQIFRHVYALEPGKGADAAPYDYIIGLFSTRRLVELLGGSIWVAPPNTCGLSINFALPIRR